MIALAGHVLMDQLKPETREWLSSIGTRVTYSSGEVIHHRGDLDPTMCIVVSGTVRLVRMHADGTHTFVSLIVPGQHFGDVLMHKGTRRTHDAIAVGMVEIDHFDSKAFARVRDNLEVLQALYAITSHRLSGSMVMSDDLRGLPRDVHIAKLLMHLSRAGGNGFTLQCLQEDLAALVGISVVTLAKSLAELKRLGLVETGYRRIRISDRERLRSWMKARSPD